MSSIDKLNTQKQYVQTDMSDAQNRVDEELKRLLEFPQEPKIEALKNIKNTFTPKELGRIYREVRATNMLADWMFLSRGGKPTTDKHCNEIVTYLHSIAKK